MTFEDYAMNLAKIFASGKQRAVQQSRLLEIMKDGIEPRKAVFVLAARCKGYRVETAIRIHAGLWEKFPEPQLQDTVKTVPKRVVEFKLHNGVLSVTFADGSVDSWAMA